MRNKIIIIICAVLMAFVVSNVSAQNRKKVKKQTGIKTQSIRVELTERGYQPVSFRLKKNIPARVTFIRKTEDECGREIVIPAYNIRRELPLNQPVTISFTPKRTGSFNFMCGMDMLRGKLIVQ